MKALLLFALAAAALADTSCKVLIQDTEEFKAYNYDLTGLNKGATDLSFTDADGTNFHARFCGKTTSIGCTGHAICAKTKAAKLIGWGLAQTQSIVKTDLAGQSIATGVLVQYAKGDKCDSGVERSAKVYVNCDKTATTPKIVDVTEENCVLTMQITSAAGCGVLPVPDMYFTSPLSSSLFGLRLDRKPESMYELNSMRSPELVSTNDYSVFVTEQRSLIRMPRGDWSNQETVFSGSFVSELSASNNTVFYVVSGILYARDTKGKTTKITLPTTGTVSGEAIDDEHFGYVNGVDQLVRVVDLTGQVTTFPIPTACTTPYQMSYSRISGITTFSCPEGKLIAGILEDLEQSYELWTLPTGWTKILSASHYNGHLYVLDKALGLLYAPPRSKSFKVYPTTADFSIYDFDFDYD